MHKSKIFFFDAVGKYDCGDFGFSASLFHCPVTCSVSVEKTETVEQWLPDSIFLILAVN